MTKVIVYADINLNIIDGSSIWLTSITTVCAQIFDEVHLQLKSAIQNSQLIAPLRKLENVSLHEPSGEVITISEAVEVLSRLDKKIAANVVIARGLEVCFALSNSNLHDRLWSYVTDLPFPPESIESGRRAKLGEITDKSFRMFAQTEAARSYLEGICPRAAGKTALMNPMIPEEAFQSGTARNNSERLRLVYSGKLAKDWKTLEMLDIPKYLAQKGIDSELIVVGAKINASSTEPEWPKKMKEAITSVSEDPDSRVTWKGSLSREESISVIQSAHIGIGWRSAALDSSLEISTKSLEYSACGVPSLVNRNRDNELLFGSDYPLFCKADDTAENVAEIIEQFVAADGVKTFSGSVRRIAEHYSMEETAHRLQTQFERAGIDFQPQEIVRPVRVLLVSHDLKFMGELMTSLESDVSFELKVDKWESLTKHNERESRSLARWADVVFCEWAGPSVKFFADNKPEGVALIARLHGFELRTGTWLNDFDFSKLDRLILVSEHYQERAIEHFGLERSKTSVIPNVIDQLDLLRPKIEGAQFHLGLVGMVPFLKRPDRALDLLEELLQTDSRFFLHIKGRAPWEYPYEWKKPLTKQLYLNFFSRLSENPELRKHVVFHPFGPQIGSWFRQIGFVLSPSDEESFHLAPAEGMSSGCVPVVWNREGAEAIFGTEAIVDDAHKAASKILGLVDSVSFAASSEKAVTYAQRWDLPQVIPLWKSMFKSAARAVSEER